MLHSINTTEKLRKVPTHFEGGVPGRVWQRETGRGVAPSRPGKFIKVYYDAGRDSSLRAEDRPETGCTGEGEKVGCADTNRAILGVDREDEPIVKGIDVGETGLAIEQSVDGRALVTSEFADGLAE